MKELTPKMKLKMLRRELHYHQGLTRVDIRAVKAGIEKAKLIGSAMRKIQKEMHRAKKTKVS